MEASCKFDFQATADDELSFQRGNTIKVSSVNVAQSVVNFRLDSLCLNVNVGLHFFNIHHWLGIEYG